MWCSGDLLADEHINQREVLSRIIGIDGDRYGGLGCEVGDNDAGLGGVCGALVRTNVRTAIPRDAAHSWPINVNRVFMPRVVHNPNVRVSRVIHGHRVRMRRTAPNFTGVERAVEYFTSLPTIRSTEQKPALRGIYFNRAIRAHGAPIDKELQLASGRRVEFGFELGDFRFALRMSLIPCFHLGFDLGKLFHLGFYLREFLAHLRKGVMVRRRFASNKCHSRNKHEQLHGSVH